MNNMRKMALLLLLAAASNGVKALDEVVRLQAGQAFTLRSRVEAVGTGLPPKYQWYRDGSPIAGATSPDYTIPAGLAVGSNVQFKRAAYTDGCAERMFTNTITITWCNLMVDGVCWADVNVAQPGTFAPKPDMYTEFYQWNQPTVPWHPTDPGNGIAISGWPTYVSASAWISTPCPDGWRLPTREEMTALNNAGSTWVAANGSRGNAVAGRFYGPNHNNAASCTLPSNMLSCLFLSAAGSRYSTTGQLADQNAALTYWTSTRNSSSNYSLGGYALRGTNNSSALNGTYDRGNGLNIRCVQ